MQVYELITMEPLLNEVLRGLRKLVRYIEGSLYRGSFQRITLLLG